MIATDLRPKITTGVMEIPTCLILADPDQPRKEFPPEYIAGLGASIRAEGLLQPITVRKHPAVQGQYLIVAGECRWRAHAVEGLKTVRCIVSHAHDDERRRFRIQSVENFTRRNMTFREEANAIVRMKGWGDTEEEIGKAVGLSAYRVSNILTLSGLSEELWRLLDSGAVNRSLAEYAAGKVPKEHVEDLLLRGVGKTKKAAAAIIGAYVAEANQAKFDLEMQSCGVADKKDDIAKDIACQLLKMAGLVEGIRPSKMKVFSRQIGTEVVKLCGSTKRSKKSAQFLLKVFNQIDAQI